VIGVVVVLAFFGGRALSNHPYKLTLIMPSADQAFAGGRVLIKGQTVGSVSSIGVKDGQAVVNVDIDPKFAPLPSGTKAQIKWESVLGARVVELVPGKAGNPPLASGHVITGNTEAVDIDDLFATLDAPTRAHLQTLIANLNSTLSAKQGDADINTTLREAGPTFQAIGQLVQSIGQDGPAIRNLVSQLHGVTSTVSARDSHLVNTINQLNTLTTEMAARQQQLSDTIARLPETVSAATAALNDVPGAVGSTRTLLRTLQPSTAQLPAIAKLAGPVLTDAQPALALLPGTLQDADRLLKQTPGLVSDVNATLPDVNSALITANPMVSFLRPYTPELVGWLSNWDGVFGSMDGSGHYARALITASASSLDELPAVPPGMSQNPTPAPGSLVGQPWTDANGDGLN
jgi:phospholipid/cholesterol/gamma-HCH transport system substrate-binding protein